MERVVTIVSGLPRSGTSMMMRMLEAGGIEILFDNRRKADEDNPKGYYEFEKVKTIKKDSSWLASAESKAFKMVSMLLYDLPSNWEYRIVFMKRNIDEILASQKRMLERSGRNNSNVSDKEMSILFNKHLAEVEKWLGKQNNINTLYISYNDTILKPLEAIQKLNRFLGNELYIDKMAKIVNKSLYRQRSNV